MLNLNLSTLTSAVIITAFVAAQASANGVYNSYETTVETGVRNIEVDRVRVETGTINDVDVSIKMEADKGDINRADIKFDGTNFSGSASSSNGRPIDPVVYGTFTKTITDTQFTQVDNTSVDETVNFTTNIYTHTVGNVD